MADIKFAQNADFNQKEARNMRVHNVNGTPSTPVTGQIWYDTADGFWKYRSAASVTINPLDRTKHIGVQTAATISDFDTQVRTSRLDQMSVPTASVNFNSQKGINQLDPTNPQDSATKAYVDAALVTATSGITWKQEVRVATTANGTLATAFANGQTVDGVVLATNDRILLKSQSTGADNGIYTVNAAGAPTRAVDANTAAELQGGVIVAVDEGTANNNTAWMLSSDVVTLGTTSQTWVQFGAGSAYTASLGVQLVGNDFRANLGTGLTLSGNQIVPDFTSIMARKVATGFVGTTGVDITITTGFTVANKADHIVRVYEDTGGAEVQVGVTATSTTQVTISFDTTPTTNQYRYVILGLS